MIADILRWLYTLCLAWRMDRADRIRGRPMSTNCPTTVGRVSEQAQLPVTHSSSTATSGRTHPTER